MKKFYFFMSLILFSSLLLISCVDNVFVLAREEISEVRNNILAYSDDDFYVTFMSGQREEVYNVDGVASNNIDFAIITVECLADDVINQIAFETVIADKTYSGELIQNPYDNTFVTDLRTYADNIDTINLKLNIDNNEVEFVLTKVNSDWQIDNMQALEIVCKDLHSDIKEYIKDNQLQAEVYIKIVYNREYSTEYYWYINIVTISGKNFTEIINPINGEILAKNISG